MGPPTMAGLILQAQGKEDEARTRYERLVEVAPRAAVASNNLAWMYASRGENLDRALELAQKAKAELPDHPEVNDTLAYVYLKKNLPALAIPPLRLAIEKQPSNPSFHYHLGLALRADRRQGRGAQVPRGSPPPAAGLRRGGRRAEGAGITRLERELEYGMPRWPPWAGYVAALTLLFIQPLARLVSHALQHDLHSHIVLIPFIAGYLLYTQRASLPPAGRPLDWRHRGAGRRWPGGTGSLPSRGAAPSASTTTSP